MSALGVLRRAMVGRGDGAGREATGAEGTREAASASRRRREKLNERGPGRFARERAAPERGRVHLLEPKRDGERHSYADRPPALEARREPALADGLNGGLVAPPRRCRGPPPRRSPCRPCSRRSGRRRGPRSRRAARTRGTRSAPAAPRSRPRARASPPRSRRTAPHRRSWMTEAMEGWAV